MQVIRIGPDGKRVKVLGYGDLTLDLGRAMVRAAAKEEAGPGGTVTERVVPRGDLQVYVAFARDAADQPVATFEEYWPSDDADKAKEFFDRVQELDGCGLVTTDDDLLAETIAKMFDVRPEEVYDDYTDEAEDEEDEEVVAAPGVTMVALCSAQGTACDEAGLCSKCDTPERRAAIDAERPDANMPEDDRPIPGVWHDVTGNDAVQCQECGKITVDPADGHNPAQPVGDNIEPYDGQNPADTEEE